MRMCREIGREDLVLPSIELLKKLDGNIITKPEIYAACCIWVSSYLIDRPVNRLELCRAANICEEALRAFKKKYIPKEILEKAKV